MYFCAEFRTRNFTMKISYKSIKIWTLIVATLISFNGFALDNDEKHGHQDDNGEINTKDEINAYIQHHLKDSYDFSLFSYVNAEGEKVHVGFPLPVILWDDGLKVFSSSKLHHDEAVFEMDGNFYKSYHGKIYKTNKEGTLHFDDHHHPTNDMPLDFSITKNVTVIFIVGLLILWIFK